MMAPATEQREGDPRPQTKTALDEILLRAATWKTKYGGGRDRMEDGTVPGWHDWAKEHPQADNPVRICQGRSEWAEANEATSRNNPNTLSIVSWNTLCDAWYRKEVAKKDSTVFNHTPPKWGDWHNRFPLMLEKWLKPLNPDVLCLQEVDYAKFETEILPELKRLGYMGKIQKPKKQSEDQPCGAATFWKADKFQLVDAMNSSRSLCVLLSATAWAHHSQGEASTSGATLPEVPQLCIANLHLESSQSQEGSDRRIRQLNSALEYAARLNKKTKNQTNGSRSEIPLVMCGDCNTGADSVLHHALRHHSWHGHALASVYEHPATAKTTPVNRATFCVPRHHYVIDHAWYTSSAFQLTSVLDALSPEELVDYLGPLGCIDKGFPNEFCPSDHLPVGAILEYTPPNENRRFTTGEEQDDSSTIKLLSPELQAKLRSEWQALDATKPPKIKGKPNQEQIEEAREHKRKVIEWRKTVEEDGNLSIVAFVAKLIKK